MKILFIGCVESSYRLLKELLDQDGNVVGVITKEKSGFNSDFCNLTTLCEERRIPCHYADNINDADSVSFIKKYKPDIGFCFGWSQLVKKEVIRLFDSGIVGFHPAELPDNRGRHPLIWALALGLPETASTFFMMNEGADTGDIIAQQKIRIAYEDDARTLYDKVIEVAVQQEKDLLERLECNSVTKISQKSHEGNSWRKRGKSDGEIDWRMSSRNIYNLVRSLTRPYAGAHFVFRGNEYKVWKAEEIHTEEFKNIEPGKILNVNSDGTVEVKAGDNADRLVEYDPVDFKKGDYIL